MKTEGPTDELATELPVVLLVAAVVVVVDGVVLKTVAFGVVGVVVEATAVLLWLIGLCAEIDTSPRKLALI